MKTILYFFAALTFHTVFFMTLPAVSVAASATAPNSFASSAELLRADFTEPRRASFTEPQRASLTEPWREDYGTPPAGSGEIDAASVPREEELRWLYEKLFPVEIREQAPIDVWRSFKVHLQDTYPSYPDPASLRKDQLKTPAPVEGMITYIGMFRKKYAYEVFQDADGTLVLSVKIHLKNPTPEDEVAFAEKVAAAQTLWDEYRLPLDFPYRFQFQIVKTAAEAPFSVNIVNSTRGPYDTLWGRDWDPNTIAHEIGHMMGLGDEYQPFGKAFGCHMQSLMCSSSKGKPMPHLYYFVLRRLVNP